jgi:hypothetical protein
MKRFVKAMTTWLDKHQAMLLVILQVLIAYIIIYQLIDLLV